MMEVVKSESIQLAARSEFAELIQVAAQSALEPQIHLEFPRLVNPDEAEHGVHIPIKSEIVFEEQENAEEWSTPVLDGFGFGSLDDGDDDDDYNDDLDLKYEVAVCEALLDDDAETTDSNFETLESLENQQEFKCKSCYEVYATRHALKCHESRAHKSKRRNRKNKKVIKKGKTISNSSTRHVEAAFKRDVNETEVKSSFQSICTDLFTSKRFSSKTSSNTVLSQDEVLFDTPIPETMLQIEVVTSSKPISSYETATMGYSVEPIENFRTAPSKLATENESDTAKPAAKSHTTVTSKHAANRTNDRSKPVKRKRLILKPVVKSKTVPSENAVNSKKGELKLAAKCKRAASKATPDGFKTVSKKTKPVANHVISNEISPSSHTVKKGKKRGARNRKFRCHHCPMKFRLQHYLDRHNFISHSKRSLSQEPFNQNHLVRDNVRKVKNLPYECEWCDNSFCEKSELISHLRNHRNERSFQCSSCKISFRSRVNCTTHITKKHFGDAKVLKTSLHSAQPARLNLLKNNYDRKQKPQKHKPQVWRQCDICKVLVKKENVMMSHFIQCHSKYSTVLDDLGFSPLSCKTLLKPAEENGQTIANPTLKAIGKESLENAAVENRIKPSSTTVELPDCSIVLNDIKQEVQTIHQNKLKSTFVNIFSSVAGTRPAVGDPEDSRAQRISFSKAQHNTTKITSAFRKCTETITLPPSEVIKCIGNKTERKKLKRKRKLTKDDDESSNSSSINISDVNIRSGDHKDCQSPSPDSKFHSNAFDEEEEEKELDDFCEMAITMSSRCIFFTCDTCGKTFHNETVYKRHVRFHDTDESLVCCVCSQAMPSREDLLIHYADHKTKTNKSDNVTQKSPKTKPRRSRRNAPYPYFPQTISVQTNFPCHFCPQTFTEESVYKLHIKMHEEEVELQTKSSHSAKTGNSSSSNQSSSTEHHNPESSTQMSTSAVTVKKESALNTESDQDIPCLICSLKFRSSHELIEHYYVHQNERNSVTINKENEAEEDQVSHVKDKPSSKDKDIEDKSELTDQYDSSGYEEGAAESFGNSFQDDFNQYSNSSFSGANEVVENRDLETNGTTFNARRDKKCPKCNLFFVYAKTLRKHVKKCRFSLSDLVKTNPNQDTQLEFNMENCQRDETHFPSVPPCESLPNSVIESAAGMWTEMVQKLKIQKNSKDKDSKKPLDSIVCPECGVRFRHNITLNKHLRKVHADSKYIKTSVTSMAQPTISSTEEAVIVKEEPSKEDEVNEVSSEAFQGPIKDASSTGARETRSRQTKDTQNNLYRCSLCATGFPFEWLRQVHVQNVHGSVRYQWLRTGSKGIAKHDSRQDQPPVDCRPTESENGVQRCSFCEMTFDLRKDLEQHLNTCHLSEINSVCHNDVSDVTSDRCSELPSKCSIDVECKVEVEESFGQSSILGI